MAMNGYAVLVAEDPPAGYIIPYGLITTVQMPLVPVVMLYELIFLKTAKGSIVSLGQGEHTTSSNSVSKYSVDTA